VALADRLKPVTGWLILVHPASVPKERMGTRAVVSHEPTL